ncbi:hypothetical protein BGZ83_005640 [Gryganskiella cystojenkinii]|nr:hypothetical protein BGZ83_005640 [Gryganskiella cystojenkinii]
MIALNITEILINIGTRMDLHTLATCVRVSQRWHLLLIPILYRSFKDEVVDNSKNKDQSEDKNEDTVRLPSPEGLIRHAHLIRKLIFYLGHRKQRMATLSTFVAAAGEFRCDNLLQLEISVKELSDDDIWQCGVGGLVLLNQGLVTLKIEDAGKLSRPCWVPLFSQCGHVLQELCLYKVRLSHEDTEQILNLGSILVKLILAQCPSKWSSSSSSSSPASSSIAVAATTMTTVPPRFPRLRILTIKDVFDSALQEFEWIQQCPVLTELTWSSLRPVDTRWEIYNRLASYHRWSQLQEISIAYLSVKLSDCEIARILGACGSTLVGVELKDSFFRYCSLQALERHSETLERLDLCGYQDIPSWMVTKFLTTFTKMKCIRCDSLAAHELVRGHGAEEARAAQLLKDNETDLKMRDREVLEDEGFRNLHRLNEVMAQFINERTIFEVRPWVCLGLVNLTIFFDFKSQSLYPDCLEDNDHHLEWQDQIFAQLAKLTQLQTLNVSTPTFDMLDQRSLQLTLRAGLGQLVTLRRLQSLFFYGTVQEMSEADVHWMLEHWPDLESVSSELHVDAEICKGLKEIFHKQGIETCTDELKDENKNENENTGESENSDFGSEVDF